MSAAKKTYSSVFRLRKLKTVKQLLGAGEHNLRTKKPMNADPKRERKNQVIIGAGKTPLKLVNERIKNCEIKPRKNAVRAYEFILSAGRPFFQKLDPEKRQEWVDQSLDYVRGKFGFENVVHATLHDDETTLHLHVVVVPIRAADDKDGPVYSRQRKREWKLDSKGILEQLADKRPLGSLDRAAAEFRQSDLVRHAKLISQIKRNANSKAEYLGGLIPVKSLNVFRNKKAKASAKQRALIQGLNKVLDKNNSIYDPAVFAGATLSADTQQLLQSNPVGDELHRLNRRLLDDLLPDFFHPMQPRRIGSPTTPFMHQLQVEFFNLCRRFDPQIFEPLYRAKIAHSTLSEYYSRLEQSVRTFSEFPKLDIQEPGRTAMSDPKAYVASQERRVKEQLRPVTNALLETIELRHELEAQKNAIRLVNQANEKSAASSQQEILSLKQQLQASQNQVNDLRAENANLLNQLRSVSLVDVMQKLKFPQLVASNPNQYRLPDDRIIEINGQSFKEITGRNGLGGMADRKSARGAIDLVIFVTGWELTFVRQWLVAEFGQQTTLQTIADEVKTKVAAELENDKSQTENLITSEPSAIYHQPDESQWPALRDRLTGEFQLPTDAVDELHNSKTIHANQFGALVCYRHDDAGNPLTAVVQAAKSMAEPGAHTEIQITPAVFPFYIGKPAKELTLTLTPLNAIAQYAALNGNCCIFPTGQVPSHQLMEILNDHAKESGKPISIAFDSTADGEKYAEVFSTLLEIAQVPSIRQPLLRPTTVSETKPAKTENRILTLQDVAPLWKPDEDAWGLLLQELTRKHRLDEKFLRDRYDEKLIWATAANTLAVARTDWDNKDKSHRGVTLLDIANLEQEPKILVPDKGGVFWLGAELASANVIVGVANPLEALSYRAIHDLAPEPLVFGRDERAKPLIISLDGELPSASLFEQIRSTGKPFWLATNTTLNVGQIIQQIPEVLDASGNRLVAWWHSRPLPANFSPQQRFQAWNNHLVKYNEQQQTQAWSPNIQGR